MPLLLALLIIPLAGCAPGGAAQSATATANAQATGVSSPLPAATSAVGPDLSITPSVSAQATSGVTATVGVSGTAAITATGVVTPSGPAPTPSGPAPDPLDVLNIFQFFSPGDTLVSRDPVNLDGQGADEVLYTVTGRGAQTTTQEVQSGLGVLMYDSVNRRWDPLWASGPISGTASPLPAANRQAAGGYNGGNILGNGGPIIVARTTTNDGKAHLYLWRWDGQKRTAAPVKMAQPGGAGDANAVFIADLDANMADIDDDGVYEVILDNLASAQIWKWDVNGNRFVPGGER